ncbi:MAG: metal ABC transporter permease [Clostridia bacterium]|nr:metal ABC transporter permease [Clostridia bacterium]
MLEALLEYKFLQNAFLSTILASITCGIMGTIITEKKLVMLSGGIAHTTFGGIGLGYFLGIEPIISGLFFSIIASLGISRINKKTDTYSDLLIGMFWSLGMALGVLFIAFTPGYPPDMTSYLFGDILTVSRKELLLMLIFDLIIITIIVSFFNIFKAYLFDEEFLAIQGAPILLLEYLLYILIACTVVLLVKVTGIILSIALLTVPIALAKQFTYNLKNLMILSCGLGAVFCLMGLFVSYKLGIPSGATIIIIAIFSYLTIVFLKKKTARKHSLPQ